MNHYIIEFVKTCPPFTKEVADEGGRRIYTFFDFPEWEEIPLDSPFYQGDEEK